MILENPLLYANKDLNLARTILHGKDCSHSSFVRNYKTHISSISKMILIIKDHLPLLHISFFIINAHDFVPKRLTYEHNTCKVATTLLIRLHACNLCMSLSAFFKQEKHYNFKHIILKMITSYTNYLHNFNIN